MSSLKKNLFNPYFSHIYIEKEVRNHSVTERILSSFPNSSKIEINHYKEVFCRSHQNFRMQKQSMSLILADKHQNLIYEGAPVCQDFGNQHFYYTSSVMNCIYDCEYCYLQGMYPCAYMVVFVNLEEIFKEVEKLLAKYPVYLCVSYDTDLMAIDALLGYVGKWIGFAARHPDLTIEIRTKSANWNCIQEISPLQNVILAWTLSPERITEQFEHRTPSLEQRLACVNKALEAGWHVRLCFDPLLYCRDFKVQYEDMMDRIFSKIPVEQIKDISVGTFRISQDYLKNIRRQNPDSSLVQFPFQNDNGVYHYGKQITNNMISCACEQLRKRVPEDRIFLWERMDQ